MLTLFYFACPHYLGVIILCIYIYGHLDFSNGESTYNVKEAQEMRLKIIKMYESIDALRLVLICILIATL